MAAGVVKNETHGFKGRLGYACLNTILRFQKPPVFCSRTCRIDTIKEKGLDYVKELGRLNVLDLVKLVEWNEENNIKFMRMSSDMFPFASHDDWGYSLEYADEELKAIGVLAKKYGHRLTTHPGQFNQLGSPKSDVVRRTVKDLAYHAEMIDRMGLDQDSIMIIHMGGTYGDKEATLQRFEENYLKLPQSIKNRLVLENDEMCYSVADLLPVCQKLDIPLVLDWHHHSINTGGIENVESLLPAIAETWSRKGIKPKQHYSESRKGAVTPMERRAHSDRVVRIPPCEEDMDLMIEAKDKEQAVLQLYRDYKLYEISDDVLREPGEETKQTKGRKSSKKTKIEERDIISTDAEGVKIRKRQQRKVDVEKEIADEFIELPTDNVDEQHDIIPKKRLSRKIKSVTMETTNIPIPAVDEKIESNDSIEKGESTNSKKPKGRPRKRPGKVVKTNNIENSPVITSSTENMPNFEVALPKPVKHSRRVSKPGAPSPDIAHPLTNAVPARQRSVRQK